MKMSTSKPWLAVLMTALALSGAGCKKKVPDLIGMTKADADQVLTKKGLKLGTVTTGTQEGADPGSVIDQEPKAQAEIPGSKIVTVVLQQEGGGPIAGTGAGGASPDGSAAVPRLTGLSQAAAEATLMDAGLARGSLEALVSDKPAGEVIGQDPPAGTPVRRGSTVDITIAGSAVAAVPNVIGQPRATAEQMIRDAGFVPGDVTPVITTTSQPAGTVVGQNPGSGMYGKGQPVSLQVKQDSVIVPDVVRMDSKDAQIALFAAGLQPATECVRDLTLQPGVIASQTVMPRSVVARDTQVVIRVSQPTTCLNHTRVLIHRGWLAQRVGQ
jgi:beta-lactam-binding protein with PASTA domain